LEQRQRKKKLKEIEKAEKVTIEDERIFQALKRKMKPQELEEENAKLKAELLELRKEKAKRKVERPKTPPQEEEKVKEKKEVVAPKPVPIKEVKKPMTARQKMKLLKGL